VHALGQFWRVMSDLFLDLARAEREGQVRSIAAVVAFIQQGLVAAAALPITYGVSVAGEHHWILPPEASLTFLVDVALPYVEAVFLRGMPFFGTVSFNAQAEQISPDQSRFCLWGALCRPATHHGGGDSTQPVDAGHVPPPAGSAAPLVPGSAAGGKATST
jgi:hypothetical protein